MPKTALYCRQLARKRDMGGKEKTQMFVSAMIFAAYFYFYFTKVKAICAAQNHGTV